MHVGLMVYIQYPTGAIPKFESVIPATPDMNFGKCEAAGNLMCAGAATGGFNSPSSCRPGSADPSMTGAVSSR